MILNVSGKFKNIETRKNSTVKKQSAGPKCPACKKTFYDKSNLNKHMKGSCGVLGKTREKSIRCPICTYKTNNKHHLSEHLNTRHKPKEERDVYQCKKCHKVFLYSNGLRRHLRVCEQKTKKNLKQQEKFYCHHCEYKAKSKQHLEIHITARHQPRDSQASSCSGCGMSSSQPRSLRRHHLNCELIEEPVMFSKITFFHCHHCPAVCHRKDYLVRHLFSKHFPFWDR